MASHEGSRKRLKISRTEGRPKPSCPTPNPASASTSISAKTTMATDAGASANMSTAPCAHSLDLKTLHTDIEAMRQLVTCKICDRLLYEPYSLSCGHTYCYSCLSQWLVSSHKKTCPDCRSPVRQQPTPSYIIRELVLIFVSRTELLPDGETSEEHNKLVKEEAEIVAKDKANKDARTGGLFKGCFSRGGHPLLPAIHDPGDGVYRCPDCNWELEDGMCNSCGWDEAYGAGSPWPSEFNDDSDLDLDHELDDELERLEEESDAVYGADGADEYFGDDDFDEASNSNRGPVNNVGNGYAGRYRHPAPRGRAGYRGRVGLQPYMPMRRRTVVDLRSSEDESSEDDDDGEEMNDFIVDDDRHIEAATSDDQEDDEDTDVPLPTRHRDHGHAQRRNIVVISDGDDQSSTIGPQESESESESEESEDDLPVVSGSQRRKRLRGGRNRRAQTISSDGDDTETSQDEVDDEDDRREAAIAGGFSPLDRDGDSDESDDESEDRSDY